MCLLLLVSFVFLVRMWNCGVCLGSLIGRLDGVVEVVVVVNVCLIRWFFSDWYDIMMM